MSITIELRPDDEQVLRERAGPAVGSCRSTCNRSSKSTSALSFAPRRSRDVRSDSGPRLGWRRQSGMADEEIDAMFQRELEEFRRERLERRGME